MDDRALAQRPLLPPALPPADDPILSAATVAAPASRILGAIAPGRERQTVRIAIVQDGAYQPQLWIPPCGHRRDIVTTVHASMPANCFSGWGGDLDCLIVDLLPEAGAGSVNLRRARELAQCSLLIVLCERIDVRLSALLFDHETLILPRPLGPSEAQMMLRRFADMAVRRRRRTARPSERAHEHAASSAWNASHSGARAAATPLAPDIQVDFDNRVLYNGSAVIPLRRGESDLLRYLYEQRHTWSTTERIRKHVFNREDPAGLTLVWKYASELRRKLGQDHDLLQTSRTRGYLLTTSPGAPSEEPGSRSGPRAAAENHR